MKRAAGHIVYRALVCSLLLLVTVGTWAQDDEWLSRKVQLSGKKDTRYQLLRQLSDQTGYLFVYDSRTLNNDVEVKPQKGEYTLREAIYTISGIRNLQIARVGENHILLSLSEKKPQPLPIEELQPEQKYFTVSGTVYDLFSKEVVSAATVSIVDANVGTVTNRNGRFRLTLPDTLQNTAIRISHVGYERLEFNASLWVDRQSNFMLEPKVVSLQEVVVRVVNPRQLLRKMLDERSKNYAEEPAYLTAFYREGVEHKKRNVDLTEAVLKIYKTNYEDQAHADQVKLIKMRRILDQQERDTIVTKVKSGIHSILLLDLIKNEPDFFDIDETGSDFTYAHTDIAVIDDRLANVIAFEQRKGIREPLYQGELFIDTENNALLEARFEINPEFIGKATHLFVEKKSKHHKLMLHSAKYVVSYKPSADGTYFINHVRGDLEFRVRRKRQWFTSPLNVWFEFVNCKVDEEDVQPFPRTERLSPRSVFSETKHPYDADFWGNFNVILPEEELKELILNNLTDVMESP